MATVNVSHSISRLQGSTSFYRIKGPKYRGGYLRQHYFKIPVSCFDYIVKICLKIIWFPQNTFQNWCVWNWISHLEQRNCRIMYHHVSFIILNRHTKCIYRATEDGSSIQNLQDTYLYWIYSLQNLDEWALKDQKRNEQFKVREADAIACHCTPCTLIADVDCKPRIRRRVRL